MALPDFQTYGALVYSLQERYPSIQHTTLVLATIGATLTKLEGQVTFAGDVILDVWELIDFEAAAYAATATKSIRRVRKSPGMTRLNILISPSWPVPIHTTSISHPTSSTTACQRLASVSHSPTCPH